jgi:hypothetical protein
MMLCRLYNYRLFIFQAIDTPRIGYIVGFIYLVYTTPFAIVVALYYLYNLMGWSCFVGMTIILVSMPLNTFIQKQYTKVQERLMAARDKRVTLMNEVSPFVLAW